MGEWEYFGRICERDRTFAWGIEGSKQIYEEGDQTDMGFVLIGNPETET
jgi:hypothetical protein